LDKVLLEAGAAMFEDLRADPRGSGLSFLVWKTAQGHDSPSVRQLFRQFANSANPAVKALGIAELVRRGDSSALHQLEAETAVLAEASESTLIVHSLAMVRDSNPETIRALSRLAASGSKIEGLNLAAARALRSMHTEQTLPYLASLLDSDDPNMRAEGVLGLSFYANGVPIVGQGGTPGMSFLRVRKPTKYTTKETREYLGFDPTRENEFIAFWRDWWLRHRNELSQ
jgi:hypothetical protein